MTVLGIRGLRRVSHWVDVLLVLNAIGFLTACFLSYFGLRGRDRIRKLRLDLMADRFFMGSLIVMVVICAALAYEFI